MPHRTSSGRPFRALLAVTPAFLALLACSAPRLAAQEPLQAGSDALRVYLDCSGGWRGGHCSSDQYRQEITFVHWVREPQDAQVHIILTSQNSGGGGTVFTLDFLGRESLAGMEDRFTYSSSVTDVQDETVRGLIQTVRVGLVRFAGAAGFGDAIEVRSAAAETAEVRAREAARQVGPADDPWNLWVFNVDANASFESEDLQQTKDFGFGLSANRTTEQWKLNFRAGGNFEREVYEIPEDDGTIREIHNDQDRWSVSGFAVKSLGAHWGVGAELGADNSTQLNRDLLVGFGTGMEFNFFPYSESNRRVFLARYVLGVDVVQYQDSTIFDQLEETVYQHEARVEYEAREPWGNANVGMGVSQYLDRTDAWSFGVNGFVRYRLFRGFSVNVSGSYREVRDQIYLSKEELSDEDILLGRRQLPTEAEMEFRIGFSYSFGSIFNNAVNERFRRGVN